MPAALTCCLMARCADRVECVLTVCKIHFWKTRLTSQIGKLVVFESGCVKLWLGSVLMDVTPVQRNSCRQDIVAMATTKDVASRRALWLSEVEYRATVTPDLEQLLEKRPIGPWGDADVPERYSRTNLKAAWMSRGYGPYRPARRPSKSPVVVRMSGGAPAWWWSRRRFTQKSEPGLEEETAPVEDEMEHDAVDEEEDYMPMHGDELVDDQRGGSSGSE